MVPLFIYRMPAVKTLPHALTQEDNRPQFFNLIINRKPTISFIIEKTPQILQGVNPGGIFRFRKQLVNSLEQHQFTHMESSFAELQYVCIMDRMPVIMPSISLIFLIFAGLHDMNIPLDLLWFFCYDGRDIMDVVLSGALQSVSRWQDPSFRESRSFRAGVHIDTRKGDAL